ncbi:scavenger receptor cysteine-rich type 1 protein M130-like [Dendronephthya gigantea]|uniref:scavenger receptor cysteine-rich type 1 protein M130-like n=1 Tax=Dendronephthya gigantea TaxID=151771 RepID=UPI00106CED51|nr:scavenger receptor cysteine-rich type 1 protein M130-like [Dendronephthya gigantea]
MTTHVFLDKSIRLRGPSRLNGTGRVEILYLGIWGTICDDNWDINDARVACRQLGYWNALRALRGRDVPSGSGQIWLDEVGCTGTEQNLESCPHNDDVGWGSHDCDHSEDAGVGCTSGDLDYCSLGLYQCGMNFQCVNTDNGVKCICDQGFTGDDFTCSDINECSTVNNCHSEAFCTNTQGSYRCTCNGGFTGNGTNCQDVDECSDSTHKCPSETNCTNTNGSYQCCRTKNSGNSSICRDVDYCSLGLHNCSGNSRCIKTDSGFTCRCNQGFTGASCDGNINFQYTSLDMNECLSPDSCHPNASCVNNYGSYRCTCNVGYTGNGTICQDINECSQSTARCPSVEYCSNIPGSFLCCIGEPGRNESTCKEPSIKLEGPLISNNTGRVEVYHDGQWGTICDINWDIHDAQVVCRQLGFPGAIRTLPRHEVPDGFGKIWLNKLECTGRENNLSSCPGIDWVARKVYCHHYKDAGVECGVKGVDYCSTGLHSCHRNAECITTVDGGFSCKCNQGYTGTGFSCNDINECSSPHICYSNALCINTPGSYQCTCKGGFIANGTVCEDYDECSNSAHYCRATATCRNIVGSYECCLRQSGGSNVTCREITVRLRGPLRFNGTGRVEVRHNGDWATICGYNWEINDARVACRQLGYPGALRALRGWQVPDGSGQILFEELHCTGNEKNLESCPRRHNAWYSDYCSHIHDVGVQCSYEDVDYCSSGLHNCNSRAQCINETDGFSCRCNPGYTGNGVSCNDINECSFANMCDSNALCTNTLGSYQCYCKSGFIKNGSVCQDADECSGAIYNCPANAICANTVGTYLCCEDSVCKEPHIRLQGPLISNGTGRVEILHAGQWGAICGNNWDIRDAQVACRQLGYPGALRALQAFNGQFTPGKRRIWLDKMLIIAPWDCTTVGVIFNVLSTLTLVLHADVNKVLPGTGLLALISMNVNHLTTVLRTLSAPIPSDRINVYAKMDTPEMELYVTYTISSVDKFFKVKSITFLPDINECIEQEVSCDSNADCLNTNGSFECRCKEGFTGDGYNCKAEKEILNRKSGSPENKFLSFPNLAYIIVGLFLLLGIILLVILIRRRRRRSQRTFHDNENLQLVSKDDLHSGIGDDNKNQGSAVSKTVKESDERCELIDQGELNKVTEC